MGVFNRNKSKGKLQALNTLVEELQGKHGISPLKQGNGKQRHFQYKPIPYKEGKKCCKPCVNWDPTAASVSA